MPSVLKKVNKQLYERQKLITKWLTVFTIVNKIKMLSCKKVAFFYDILFLVNVPIKDVLIPFENININVALTKPPQVTNSSISLYVAGRCYNKIANPTQR